MKRHFLFLKNEECYMKKTIYFLILILTTASLKAQDLAILKYKGGGDWYSNPTAVPNLITFCNQNIKTRMNTKPQPVDAGSVDLFQFPLIHMTGHGNVLFDNVDVENLRNYLTSGGFLHIDDNYGMSEYLPKELKKIFPDQDLVEGKRPQALGLYYEERLVVLFTTESDLGDGWEDQEVHGDPESIRQKALQMGDATHSQST